MTSGGEALARWEIEHASAAARAWFGLQGDQEVASAIDTGEAASYRRQLDALIMDGLAGGREEVGPALLRGRDLSFRVVLSLFAAEHERGAGEVAALVDGWVLDVTADEAARVAHEKERERLAMVLEGTRLGMWDWNPQTNEVTFDERWAEMLGHRLEEIPFHLDAWQSRVHPDDLAACFADLGRHMRGEAPFYENVHRMRHSDGRWVYILDRGRIMERDAEGRPVRFTGTHTDVTAQKVAEQQALAAAQAKSRFLAMMSHEIRTPLHGLLGIVQMLEREELSPPHRELVHVLSHSGEMLLRLLNDVLDFTKLEADAVVLRPTDVAIRSLAETIVSIHRELAEAAGLTLVHHVAPEVPPYVRLDEMRVRQMVGNLLNNALKFTQSGGISFAILLAPDDTTGATLRFEVSDTGQGIQSPEKLFEPFFQEDDSTERRHGGTGLGLAIVREIAERMGGRVSAIANPDRGSTFRIDVPLVAGRAPAKAMKVDAPLPLPHLDILVVEDNLVNQLLIRWMLKNLGQQATIVGDGHLAVDVCTSGQQDNPYDIVLLDVHLPGLSGIDVAHAIRRLPRYAATDLVALTADTDPDTIQRCRDAGIQRFLGKPFRVEHLHAVLSDIVATRGAGPPGAAPGRNIPSG